VTLKESSMKVFPLAVVLLALWGGAVGIAAESVATPHEKESLRGVAGVQVIIETMKPVMERMGLTEQLLQTDVELRLRKAGVPVLSQAERLPLPDMPWLYVRVAGLEDRTTSGHLLGYAYAIVVGFYQNVLLARDFSPYPGARTWDAERIGITSRDAGRVIRDAVGDLVDQFINDYLAVNPEMAGRTPPPRSTLLPTAESIRQAQDLLRAARFDPGPTDGKVGPQTVNALRLYQAQQGLPVTGTLDDATRAALGLK
jgi:hypothetical protein